ncbi:uncharacterized protein LOC125679249 isoform X2 [Ostrea edulis]|uniref:uncharacterized protein LOC125679249 isoform X2 n=1 Tax=Ostrea edulis TaxID=37623 RepID=UPI00209498D7|nr:uncharacterized protein LOC125679249 isoform X2 [Ostrea edulis]
MRNSTLLCLVLVLAECAVGLRIRYRYPSRGLSSGPRRTLRGWRSSSWYDDVIYNGRRRPQSLTSRIWSNDRVPYQRSWYYPDNIHSSWRSKGTGTRDRSTIHRKYGSFGDYLPLPVGEKFKSSPLKDRRATKQPLPSGHLAPEIERWGNEVKAKVRSGYYGSKPIFDQI